MRKLYLAICLIFLAVGATTARIHAQASACPSVNAGIDQTICQGQCATLTATIQGTLQTNTYAVSTIAYSPYSYTTGTQVLINIDDTWSPAISLPFCFEFFGNTYNQIVIGSNGIISFDLGYAGTFCQWAISAGIPSAGNPTNSIMTPYHDIDPSVGGSSDIRYNTYGTYPCREFVVSWYQVPMYSAACDGNAALNATQQVVLHEATNIIDIYIQNKQLCASWNGGAAIEGIQNAGGTAAFVVAGRNYPTNWTATNDGKRFMPNGAQNYSIQWFDPSMALIASTPSTVVCPVVSGTYTAVLTNTTCSGPIVVQDQMNVTISPITVTAGNGGPYCPGQTIALTATAGGTDYDWVGPAGYVQNNTQNPNIPGATLAMAGVYTVTMTNAAGCTATATTTVAVGGVGATAGNTGPYCAGATISLSSGAGGTGYSWSGPLGYTNLTQNPTIAASTIGMTGVYTVTVTYAGGCTATATTTVTVNPLPTPTANNTGPYCAGATIQLNSVGGSATDDWVGPGGYVQNNLQSPTIGASVVTMSGIYTVTVTNASGCTATATTTVTVNALPTPNATNTGPYCAGSAIQLNSVGGSATDDWVGPGGYVQNNMQNPSIAASTVGMSGVYTVTATNASGCTATATTTVTVNPLPAPTANNTGPYCTGQTIQLNSPTGSATDDWVGPLGYVQNDMQNPSIPGSTIAMSGDYTVTVTNAFGCSATATTTVSVSNAAAAVPNNTGPYCEGATINLTCPAGAIDYDWTGPGGYIQNNTQNPTIPLSTIAMSGTYTVTITMAGGCTGTGTTTVTVNPLPTPTANNTGPYCAGTTIQLNSPTGSATDDWAGPSGYAQNNLQNPAIINSTVAMNGTYTVTVTDINGCSATATTNVTVNALPVAVAGNNTPICELQDVNFNSAGGTMYDWTGPGGYNVLNTQNPTIVAATIAASGTYTVTVTDGNGCISTATTVVVVNSNLVFAAGSNAPICEGIQLDLTAQNIAGASYDWVGPNAFNVLNTQNPSIPGSTIAATGTYTVTATNAGGCTGTATVVVTINSIPTPLFVGNPLSGCAPVCANFTDQSVVVGSTIASWNWNIESQAATNTQNANYCFNNPGLYDASLTVTSAAGCSATLSFANYINVGTSPFADFLYTPQEISIMKPDVIFANTSTGAISCIWDFGDGSNSVAMSPTHTYSDTGTFCITLIADNGMGCSDTAIHCLYIKPEYSLFVPNTFTVNEDGLNDVWSVVGMNVKTISVRIYDRWGEELYFFNDINKGWPGTRQNGNPCKQDVYTYRIEVVDGNDDFHELLGQVNLIR